ncbi:MAG: hypothetical protein R3F54_24655 [Alphaproteobacteria bacterium]
MISLSAPIPLRSLGSSLALAAALVLAGCGGHSIQTTSGKDYLQKHDVGSILQAAPNSAEAEGATFDQALRHVASIEPTLTFPARIGIAKIGCIGHGQCGAIAPLHPEEARAWSEMAANLGASFGTVVPLSPLVMEQAVSEAARAGFTRQATSLEWVRLAAARQHLDLVIAYEARGRSDKKANVLALGDLTLIGAFILPSRKIESEGYAAGIILDPISGYPYGQMEAAAEDGTHSTWFNSGTAKKDLADAAAIDASVALAAETEEALREIRLALES